MKRKLLIGLYSLWLVCFTVFILLDTFVLPKNVVSLDQIALSQGSIQSSTEPEKITPNDTEYSNSDIETTSGPVITKTSYQDERFSIEISELREYDTTIYVADVVLSDPSYLRAGLAENAFGQNVSQPASQIASDVGAILAINGDFYGFRDRGYVLRNGYLYRESSNNAQDLVIDQEGDFFIVEENEVSALELVQQGAVQIFSFGPALVENGQVVVSEKTEVDQAMRSNPRTAIGQIDALHYVLVVSDGRTDESAGLSLYELALVMQQLGVKTAYNLDGGGSSTMVFMGEVINHPTSGRSIKERSVSDIVYIG